jgi:hypothetical protein
MLLNKAALTFWIVIISFLCQQIGYAETHGVSLARDPAKVGEDNPNTDVDSSGLYVLPDGTSTTDVVPVHGKVPEPMRVVLGLVIGKSTLSDAQSKLGKQTVQAAGEAGDYKAHICYKGKDGARVDFSLGELNRVTNVISDFQLVGINSATRLQSNCSVSQLVNKNIKIGAALQLGMTKKEVKSKMGVPRKVANGYFIYYFVSDEHRGQNTVTVDTSINIHFNRDIVDFIELSHTESL